MDSFITVLSTALSPQTLFGFLGGLLGSSFVMALDGKYKFNVKVILIIISAFAGGWSAEYLHSINYSSFIFGLGFISALVGVLASFIPEALRLAAPSFFDKLVSKFGNKILNNVDK